MRRRNLLLASLLAALSGCQPETPAQQPAVPAAQPAPASTPASAPAEPAAMTPAASAPMVEAAPAAKAAPAPQEKPAPAKEKPVTEKPAPAPAVVTPAAKAEPAPAVAAKPEAKPALSEADALALAKKNGCLVCHAVDKKVVGPAWRDVAAKYRGDAGAEARLMDKVAKGGSGVWGNMAMPPNSKVSEADRQALVRFVLSLK